LHQLGRVVLVQAAGAVPRVVEVDEHRRMARGGAEQIAEAAERVRPDRALLVVGNQRAQRALVLEDVEVVEPEPRDMLLELVRRIDRAQQHARLRLARQAPGVTAGVSACYCELSSASATSRMSSAQYSIGRGRSAPASASGRQARTG